MPASLLAQSAPSASTIFYLTLLFIFLAAIITTLVTRYSRDKCLKFFSRYHTTIERVRGQTSWGTLRVFSSGVEVTYDHPYADVHGLRKTSHLLYQSDLDANVLALCRFHGELPPDQQRRRLRQAHRAFNPGPLKRLWRNIRNLINAFRDGFNAAFGAVVSQVSKMNPSSAVLSSQTAQVTQIGQTLLGKFGNAFEPLLEHHIGQPVILDVADPLNPNNEATQFTGFLADYTQQWVALFNLEHKVAQTIQLRLPDVEKGDPLPPLPPPPGPGAPRIVLSPALVTQDGVELRIDNRRFRLFNGCHQPVVVRRIERPGFEPLSFGLIIPPHGTLDLPIRDSRNGTLTIDVVETVDVVAPRKYATVRHAGTLVERTGLADELALDRLPMIPKELASVLHKDVADLFRKDEPDGDE